MSRSQQHQPVVPAVLILLALCLGAAASGHAAEGKPKPPPPCSSPEHHQFDFWLGDWSVTTPDGKFAGTNLITRPLGDCVLQEHWAGSQGGKGESYNIYDAARGAWHQTWVDDGGNLLLLDGRFEDGRMVLWSRKPGSGGPPINRIIWTPVKPGEVSQLWEVSADEGKTWSQSFLGIYRPRKP